MEVKAIKTIPVIKSGRTSEIIIRYVEKIYENSVITITSKIVSICEGNVVKADRVKDKKQLIIENSDFYIDDPNMSKYNILLTVKNNNLVPSAGIDESNGNGRYILWPENPQLSAQNIWQELRKFYRVKNLGIIITDSRTTPLRWGVTGFALSWCGFKPLKSYIGIPDLFGRAFKFEQTSIIDSLAATGVYVMGEGNESTPIAIISGIPHIEFVDRIPTKKEIFSLKISLKDDIYSPVTDTPLWRKGGK